MTDTVDRAYFIVNPMRLSSNVQNRFCPRLFNESRRGPFQHRTVGNIARPQLPLRRGAPGVLGDAWLSGERSPGRNQPERQDPLPQTDDRDLRRAGGGGDDGTGWATVPGQTANGHTDQAR